MTCDLPNPNGNIVPPVVAYIEAPRRWDGAGLALRRANRLVDNLPADLDSLLKRLDKNLR